MGRLNALPSRLTAAPSRLRSPAKTVGEDPATRVRNRPNWYGTARWQKLRLVALKRDLWTCRQTGSILVAGRKRWNSAAVDHIDPHRWDPDLFWDLGNLQSVTKAWHDKHKQLMERRGLA